MQKYKTIAALVFPIAVLVLWTISLMVKILLMPDVRIRISGYDPRDLLSGHYIAYTLDWKNTDCAQFKHGECPIEEFDNHAIRAYWGKQHRFYIPEKYADELDNLFRFNKENHVFEIIYKYTTGIAPVARQLLIDGKPWQETIIDNNRGENESN